MDQPVIDFSLIAKYLSGEATPVEAMAVAQWTEKAENQKQFDEISSLWNLVNKHNIYKNPGHADAWIQLQRSLPEKNRFSKTKALQRIYAAAALVAGLIIGGMIYYRVTNNHAITAYQKLTIVSASKGLVKDTLSDGSIITLTRNSSIQYPQNFNKTRYLRLSGEAYFNVAPDKKNPFIINEGELNIKVVGTLFNVSNKENPSLIEVQVQSGIVKMFTSKKEITVSRGQTGIYVRHNNALTLANSVDANSMGYATGSFSFADVSLKEITAYLEKAFGVIILFKNNALSNCRMTARFENKSLDYIMHVISMTLNIQYMFQKNTIQIYGEACN